MKWFKGNQTCQFWRRKKHERTELEHFHIDFVSVTIYLLSMVLLSIERCTITSRCECVTHWNSGCLNCHQWNNTERLSMNSILFDFTIWIFFFLSRNYLFMKRMYYYIMSHICLIHFTSSYWFIPLNNKFVREDTMCCSM